MVTKTMVTLTITASVLIAILAVYIYYGGLHTIHIEIKEQGGETLVYAPYTGDYKDAHKVSDRIYYSLLDQGIKTYKGFGIYYDDPKKVAKEALRADVGCILEPCDSALTSKLPKEYQVKVYPQAKYITTEFPFQGQLSILIAILKVYPRLHEYKQQNGYSDTPPMEIYDMPNKKIIFRCPF